MDVQKAEQFILTTARPIEKAEFLCKFRGGPPEDVTTALQAFQNPDGGFGHALEPDNWNPHSTPITTNTALSILFDTGALTLESPMAKAMAAYIRSARDEATGRWPFTIESNKDFPHAVWWEGKEGDVPSWNPGISLAAFLVAMGVDGFRESLRTAFREITGDKSGDALKCAILAYKLLKRFGITDVVDLDETRQGLISCVKEAVCPDVEKYGVEYVATPSWFPADFWPEELQEQVRAELSLLDRQQMEDGGFDITWQWWTPYEREYRQARDWWRPRVTMEKLAFSQAARAFC